MRARIFLMIIANVVVVTLCYAQQQSFGCKSPIEYGNQNQVEPKRSSIRSISGRVIAEFGDSAKEIGPVSACLGLFTETEHRLIANAVADEEGHFRFKSVPSGRYRLVVRDPQNLLCVANMPLRIVRWPRGKGKHLVIHMRPAWIDVCSYGDFK